MLGMKRFSSLTYTLDWWFVMIDLPVLVVNFKTYQESTGFRGLSLAKVMEQVSSEYGVLFVAAPSLPDLSLIAESVNIPIFAQHVDGITPGAHTGHITAANLKELGIVGSLLNHSERRLGVDLISDGIAALKSHGLHALVCAATPLVSKALAALEPWAVAMEPPELIGGNVSVTTRPEVVKNTIALIREVSASVVPLVGAGVKNPTHLSDALNMGSYGVLLASGVAKAPNPQIVLEEMAKVLQSRMDS